MEDVFDLREFVFTILRKWRMVVICALVGCVLGGAYKLVPGGINILNGTAQQEYDKEMETYQSQADGINQQIELLQNSLDRLDEYMENSILMHIPSSEKPVASVSYYVDAKQPALTPEEAEAGIQPPNYTNRLVMAYAQALERGELCRQLVARHDTISESQYMKELLAVSYNADSGIITVEVTGSDLEMCGSLLMLVEEYMTQKQAAFSKTIYPHQLNMLSESSYYISDGNLTQMQQNQQNQRISLEQQLQERNTALSQLVVPTMTSKKALLKSGIKFIVLGLVAGGGLAVLLIFFLDMMSVKVRSEQELRRQFGLRILGVVPKK